LAVLAGFAASTTNGTATLSLTVGPQGQFVISDSNVILKIRLLPRVYANLWGDKACGIPIQKAMIISASGAYTIALRDIPHQNKGYICLLSSDGAISKSAVWPGLINTTTTVTSQSPNPSAVGQAVAIGFTVTPATSGFGTITGHVTVSDSSGDTCTG